MYECKNCGEIFSEDMAECPNCGEVPEKDAKKVIDYNFNGDIFLMLQNFKEPDKPIIINKEGIIARETSSYNPEFFRGFDFISEPHCSLSRHNKYWAITDLDSTNTTRVNGVVLTPGIAVDLHDGDVIKLGQLLTFMVHEYRCEDEKSGEEVVPQEKNNVGDYAEKWVIVCPNTLKEYEVSGPNDHINVCSCCEDLFDREKISNSRPKKVLVKNGDR